MISINDICEIINAFAITILAIITIWYAHSTQKMSKEQINYNRKFDIRYKLENVYSPLDEIIRTYLKNNIGENKLEKRINFYVDFDSNFSNLKRNYFHIMISDEVLMEFITEIQDEVHNYEMPKRTVEKEGITVDIYELDTILYRFIMYTQYKIKKYNNELMGIKSTRHWKEDAEYDVEKLEYSNLVKVFKVRKVEKDLFDDVK